MTEGSGKKLQCPECDYTSVFWDADAIRKGPVCPHCESASRVAVLRQVSGVGRGKAKCLISADYTTIDDLRERNRRQLEKLHGRSDDADTLDADDD